MFDDDNDHNNNSHCCEVVNAKAHLLLGCTPWFFAQQHISIEMQRAARGSGSVRPRAWTWQFLMALTMGTTRGTSYLQFSPFRVYMSSFGLGLGSGHQMRIYGQVSYHGCVGTSISFQAVWFEGGFPAFHF